jgi:DNA-directed RNA polymerase subunit M/transcription elongation factor TFIIS
MKCPECGYFLVKDHDKKIYKCPRCGYGEPENINQKTSLLKKLIKTT